MATRWLVTGGNGNWNSTTNWSASNGGASGASFPVAGDTANLNSAANIAINVASACAILDMTGYTGTFSGSQALSTSGNVTLGGTITYSGTWTCVGTSGTQVFTSAGKDIQLAALKVNGAGGTVQFADTFWSGQINLTNGTLDTNNQQWTTNLFNLSVGTKTLKLTNSHGIIAGTGISWDSATNQTNLTLTHGGASKLTFNGGVALTTMLVGGASGQAYDDIEFLGGAGGFTLSGQSLLYRDLLCSSPGASIVTVGNGVFRNIDFTGFLGTWNETLGTSFLGNLVFVAGMALTNATTITARGTGLQTITMAGLSATFQLNILATVGTNTVQLLDTFSGTKPVKIQKDGCGIISKAGVTNTCSLFSAVGTAGSPCTLASDTPGSPTTWSVATNEQKATALSVTDVYVTGGARWWTGRFGVDNGGNSGWRFTDWALRRPYF